MSQQINLYEARLRPSHQLFTGRNVGIGALVLLVLMVALAFWTRIESDRKLTAAAAVKKDLATTQGKLAEFQKLLADRKVSPALLDEQEAIRAVLAQKQEITALLESGRLGRTTGFSGLMEGFARQAKKDLWLTGFNVTMGGSEIEIHGRMLDPALLPAYVRALSEEPVFQGQRFAALEMKEVEPAEPPAGAPAAAKAGEEDQAASVPVPTPMPRFVEFVLRSEHGAGADVARREVKP